MKNNEVYIIAELSANHNNDLQLALDTVKAIADTGADAVKVQTYTADSLTLNVDSPLFMAKKGGPWEGRHLYDLYTEASLPYEWHETIKEYAESLGLEFFSSPFDKAGVDFLESIKIELYKIASFEITDIPLIRYVASKGKPIIMSTGVAELTDIELAVKTCREVGNNDITLLKCTSEYPAPMDMANLLTIRNLKETFDVKVGLSDHTLGSTVPIAAVALGAKVVEKHFILDRSLGGPDSSFSMEPKEFADMVKAIRDTEQALGNVSYKVSEQSKMRRRSLFVSKDIKEGDIFTEENIRSVRPGQGVHPKYLSQFLGKRAKFNVSAGEPLGFQMVMSNE